jgi:hypothetical protein
MKIMPIEGYVNRNRSVILLRREPLLLVSDLRTLDFYPCSLHASSHASSSADNRRTATFAGMLRGHGLYVTACLRAPDRSSVNMKLQTFLTETLYQIMMPNCVFSLDLLYPVDGWAICALRIIKHAFAAKKQHNRSPVKVYAYTKNTHTSWTEQISADMTS